MLRVYDSLHNAIAPLLNYEGLCISEEVNGETQISFDMPRTELSRIREEYYIRTRDNEFIIKEMTIDTQDDMVRVVGKINVEELKGTPVKYFETIEKTPFSAISLALSYCPGGWTVQSDITKHRTLRQSQKTVWDIIRSALDLYMAEMEVDAINKIIIIKSKIGEDRGAYFIEDLNLSKLSVNSDTYDLVTRIYPVGKDGLTIAEVNDGVLYVDNHSYSNKVLAAYWEDNRYTNAESLKEDALEKLETLAKPTRSYNANVIDLAAISGLSATEYHIGDVVWLKSKNAETNEKHRIISMKSYPQTPEQNTCTLATNLSSLVTYMEDNLTISEAVELVVTQDGRIDSSKVDLTGVGVPPGGTKDQVLTKNSSEDGDVSWKTVEGSGGGLTLEEIEAMITIKSENIQDGAITSAKIGVAAITEAHITDAAITRAKIEDAAIDSAKIADAAITSAKIDMAAIDSTHIKDAAVETAKIADAAITTAKVGLAAIDEARIADGSITSAKIKDAEIDTAKIRDGAITSAKIGAAAINEAHIIDGIITNAKIADGAIDSAKIQDASITSAKIIELDAGLIRSGTLQTERLLITGESEDGSIKSIVFTLNEINGTPQLSTSTIDGGSITKRTINADHIIANSITSNEIAANGIKAENIDAYSVTADKIAARSIDINKIDPSVIEQLENYTDQAVAGFGEYLSFDTVNGLTIGSNSTTFKTIIGSTEMGFYNADNKVAHINGSEFNITNGKILNRLQLGHYVFVPRDSGNLSIVWED